jgi:pimeloyl-ACP methyl ester carboxylesterase
MSISDALGEQREVTLPQGTIRYRERGAGEPIVFVHGFLVNGDLWRKVVPLLSDRARCISPDWPLGSHELPMNGGADLSPPGLARVIVDFLDALGIERATLVGNDTGGALCQIVATIYPVRVRALVLTDCDAFDNFPPKAFHYLKWLTYVPGAIYLVAQSMRISPLRRTPIAFGWLSKTPVERAVMDGWVGPVMRIGGVRRDAAGALKSVSTKYTLEAAEKLRHFDQPALIAWAPDDRFFPFKHGERLAEIIPNARLERVEDSYTFVSEDQPERLAGLVDAFVGSLTAESVQ